MDALTWWECAKITFWGGLWWGVFVGLPLNIVLWMTVAIFTRPKRRETKP